MDRRTDSDPVDIKKVLLDMRKFRMGLIQTPDQLQFSFLAVLEGAKCIMGDASAQVRQHGGGQRRAADRQSQRGTGVVQTDRQ